MRMLQSLSLTSTVSPLNVTVRFALHNCGTDKSGNQISLNLWHFLAARGSLSKYRKMIQKYAKYKPIRDFNNSVLLIPTKACPNPVKQDYLRHHQVHLLQQHNEEYVKFRHIALAGAVWDDELKKIAAYRDLIKHRNSIIQNCWTRGSENEFGRLFQGFSPNGIDGLDVLEWITKQQVPYGKRVTYPGYTASNCPEKIDKPHRVRICAGGNLLPYDGDVTTHTALMETIKAHWNSVVSSKDAKYCTGDISNMYLIPDLVESEYVKCDIKLILQRIIDHYNLNDVVDNKGFVYAKINKAWFGLKQSGKIAHNDLVQHLKKHEYHQAKNTDGSFVHEIRDISFTLVVDNFGIKFTNKQDVNHLISLMQGKYKFKVDFDAEQYIGIHLNWNYFDCTV